MVAQSTIKCSWAHRSPICDWVHKITLESVLGRTEVLFVVGYTNLPLKVFLDAQKSYLWLGTQNYPREWWTLRRFHQPAYPWTDHPLGAGMYRTKFALFQVMTVRLIWMLLLMQLLPSQVMRMQLKRVQI